MSEAIEKSCVATVPSDVHQALLPDETDVRTKVGHVAKFNQDSASNNLDSNIIMDDIDNYKKPKETDEFIGLTKEELKAYINNPKWKRIRWCIAILYILILLLLLVGSILLVVFSQRCPPRPNLSWYQKEIIYEVDVTTFRDSNQDGIGDIKGVLEKLSYLEKNKIKSLLLQSSIFNVTGGTSLKLDGGAVRDKNLDLLHLDPAVGTDNDLQELSKTLGRKDMHLIIDLPLSSTLDPNGYLWYGSTSPLTNRIRNPCSHPIDGLACHYYKSYGRLPLNFGDEKIAQQATHCIRHWLLKNKADGVRVDVPLFINALTGSYEISYSTINEWDNIKKEIEQSTKPKLLLFDIPFAFQNISTDVSLQDKTGHALLLLDSQQTTTVSAQLLDKRIKSFSVNSVSKPQFWQLGSHRRSDSIGIIKDNQMPKEMVLSLIMLLGGTPVILYGEEINLDQTSFPLMSWIPDGLHGGFSSCSKQTDCARIISNYQKSFPKTNVKRQEAVGGESKDTLLTVFRHLSILRLHESFQFGLLESGYDQFTNIFWFIREAPGHKGYVVVLNLNQENHDPAHISLHELTKHDVPLHIHYEYQWPNAHLSKLNKTHIDSDNLFIHPQSINIFWWTEKLLKPNVLFKTAQEHSQKQ